MFACSRGICLVILCLFISFVGSTDVESEIADLVSLPFYRNGEGERGSQYICTDAEKDKPTPLKFRGTSLGGWLVLEPWITPSLFYQFLFAHQQYGESKGHVAIDSYSFCTVLGAKEANRQLRIHWRHWITEDIISEAASLGIDSIRIPIADWMFRPYPPFDTGCWEGSLEELDRVLDLCLQYNLKVILDIHAVRLSQNGLDNSGDTRHWQWLSSDNDDDDDRYSHWEMRGGDWAGPFDPINKRYLAFNYTNILSTVQVVIDIALRYSHHPSSIVGLQPVNEPVDLIPFELLAEFYYRCYKAIRLLAPHWIALLHDSFRLLMNDSPWTRVDTNGYYFLGNCKHFAVDTHLYSAWSWDVSPLSSSYAACSAGHKIRDNQSKRRDGVLSVIVGEWSLAVDNCAMWINGLNDNAPGYPRANCELTPCPPPYYPNDSNIPGLYYHKQEGGYDTSGLLLDHPKGTGGISYVNHSHCPVDHSLPLDDIRAFAAAQLSAYNNEANGGLYSGWFFWTIRTELESRWDVRRAIKEGLFPVDSVSVNSNPAMARVEANGCAPPATVIINGGKDSAMRAGEETSNMSLFFLMTIAVVILIVMMAILMIRRRRLKSYHHTRIDPRGWRRSRDDDDDDDDDDATVNNSCSSFHLYGISQPTCC